MPIQFDEVTAEVETPRTQRAGHVTIDEFESHVDRAPAGGAGHGVTIDEIESSVEVDGAVESARAAAAAAAAFGHLAE
ncbi:MAG: hypothetical protein K8W52_05070 [Deltaproteobacteria bacterium]|nr:hypothetical protein [Deltaproteobacteria bacterium]